MGPHSTSDDPTKYRDVIVEEGSDKDPVIITEKLLKSKGYIDDKFIESIKTRAEKIVNDKFEECAKIPAADPSSAFTGVYKESSWMLDEEVKDLL